MALAELAHLELLAEVDSLAAELNAWADRAPDWPPARGCRALVRRLVERAASLRVRLEAPLVVATLGGTGTGKSALVNALAGAEVTPTGRERPTTHRPVLICRPSLSPEMLGLEADRVELVHRDLAALGDLVLIDCPDPDTTEDAEAAGTNLARLRELLPHCDVILVVTTQQKYRSARVAEELADAAPGAKLVFVQTHADTDADIREDWRAMLAGRHEAGDLFLVDSLQALADARDGLKPRGDFARLVDLVTRQWAGAAGRRIRRANFLDLVGGTLAACRDKLEPELPAVERLEAAIGEQRAGLAAQLARETRQELLANRRSWEDRLVGRVASRWGFSPFSLVLRAYQGVGSLVSGAGLMRARTPAQMALWGTLEGGRLLRRLGRQRHAEAGAARAVAGCWEEADLRAAAIVVDGYTADSGLPREESPFAAASREAAEVGPAFVTTIAAELEAILNRLASRHTGWFTRWRYEILLAAMLGMLLYRLGRNFFYDSWLAPSPGPVFGVEFYASAAFWLLLWCLALIWAFTSRLRRGLRGEIDQLAARWNSPELVPGIFERVERQCGDVRRFRDELTRLEHRVDGLHYRLAASVWHDTPCRDSGDTDTFPSST
ncbi:MAG: GTPase family protein [Pirellulales bacterium]